MIGFLFSPGWGPPIITINLSQGRSVHSVGNELVEDGYFISKYPLVFWAKVRGAGNRLHVGRYSFPKGRSAFWILDDLVKGRSEKEKVIIPEGFASWQIAERLEALGIAEGDLFLQIVKAEDLEGFLYPATYHMDYGIGARAAVNLLHSQFDQIWSPRHEARARELGWTQKQVVTLASIIEREVTQWEEGKLVSAVYHNRLKKNMRLEADPTVQYALGYWKKRLLYRDLQKTDSPYNTYKVRGLPPGPICSPGKEAIEAALWPADFDALYFVANESGRHDFSKTYKEHLRKVEERNRRRSRR